MRNRLLVRVTLVSVLSLTSSACGFLFVNGPPTNHQNMDFFTCTNSKLAPTLDVVWGGLTALGVAAALGTSESEFRRDYDVSKNAVLAVYIPWTVVSGLSARSGFKKVSACMDANAALAARSGPSLGTAAQTPDPEVLNWRPPLLPPDGRFFRVSSTTENRPKPGPGGN